MFAHPERVSTSAKSFALSDSDNNRIYRRFFLFFFVTFFVTFWGFLLLFCIFSKSGHTLITAFS